MHVPSLIVRDGPLHSAAARDPVGGRLPLAWLLLLAAGLSASVALSMGQAWMAALAVIIILGVPHGALDTEVARPLLRPWFGAWWFPVFAAPYLALSALVLVAWRVAPEATLAAFLAVSAWHFGAEDAGSGRPLEQSLRGGLPIAVPVLLHPDATARVLGTVALTPLAGPPAWLTVGALAWAVLAMPAVVGLAREGRRTVLLEVCALALAFAVLPPLTAFALYFVGLHAPRHMASLVGTVPRLPTTRDTVLRAVPVTLLTLALGALLWPLYPGAAPARLLALTLQGLAALTLPHLLLERWAARGGTVGRHRRAAC